MQPQERKEVIRRLALTRRGRLSDDERAAADVAITDRLLRLPELASAASVLAYVSMRSEVGTAALMRAVLEAGKTLLLPYVADDGDMRASPVSSLDDLAPGYRGIPEPRPALRVGAADADIVVAPGVAFDLAGGRLGYGGGFYDAFLSGLTAPIVGLCYEVQLVEEIPMVEHDVRVGIVVTEQRVVRVGTP